MDEVDPPEPAEPAGTIKVVGTSKSGKSTLAAGLRELGYQARSCCQEHSDVPAMWQRIAPARWLILLDVTLEEMRARVPRSDWSESLLRRERQRLAHARQHADLVIMTDGLTPAEVLEQVVSFLRAQGATPRP